MDWNEVYLTLRGIWQRESGLRRAAYLIHRSLVEKPVEIMREWPLPFDDNSEVENTWQRLYEFQQQYKLKNAARA
jgi:hypothetical protein